MKLNAWNSQHRDFCSYNDCNLPNLQRLTEHLLGLECVMVRFRRDTTRSYQANQLQKMNWKWTGIARLRFQALCRQGSPVCWTQNRGWEFWTSTYHNREYDHGKYHPTRSKNHADGGTVSQLYDWKRNFAYSVRLPNLSMVNTAIHEAKKYSDNVMYQYSEISKQSQMYLQAYQCHSLQLALSRSSH